MKKNNYKLSLLFNIAIFVFTVFASFAMFAGIKFMSGQDLPLQLTKIQMFKFFTVDSNMFIGIVALIFAMEDIKVLSGKKEEISFKLYILKLMATTSVGLTFVVVFTYLGPFSEYGILRMLMNSNLFFHLITPVLSIVTFVFFEKTNKIRFKHSLFGLIPMLMYAIFYIINVFIHVEEGIISMEYDFYGFIQQGLWTTFIVVPVMLLITYLISLGLWKFNKIKS